MEANGSEESCVFMFHECRSVTIVQRQFCTYRAPVRYVTTTWSVVLLNKKIHILLSQVYCVWQAVKTPTIILNNPVFYVMNLRFTIQLYILFIGGMKNPKNLEKNLSSASLSTINLTRTDLGSNPRLRSERPTTNRLSNYTALKEEN
jgi:hypothetical protein